MIIPHSFAAWRHHRMIRRLKAEIAAYRGQRTEFVCDKAGACRAILGALSRSNDGHPTGLAGHGIAVRKKSGAWVQI